MTRTVTAMFDNRADATNAVDQLIGAGIPRSAIRVLPETDSADATYESGSSYDANRDDKGFWASLADIFMPNEDRYSYAEAMHRGSIVVSATVDDSLAERAEDILEEYDGTVDMEDRVDSWRREGWQGYTGASEASAGGFGESSGASAISGYEPARADREGVIPLAEEELQIGKREVGRGRVKVRSYVVERPVEEDVRLREEQLHVERRPVDRELRSGEADDLFRERNIEVEAHGEEAVVNKRARVREEVAVGKTVEERTETVRDTVRRTEVEIDDDATDADNSGAARRR